MTESHVCLSPTVHGLWCAGYFALKPLRQSEDGMELEVEWQWLPKVQHGPHDLVSLATPPPSTDGLDGSGGAVIDSGNVECPERVKSGDIIIFKTTDPETIPLPSFALLNMVFNLLSATAENME